MQELIKRWQTSYMGHNTLTHSSIALGFGPSCSGASASGLLRLQRLLGRRWLAQQASKAARRASASLIWGHSDLHRPAARTGGACDMNMRWSRRQDVHLYGYGATPRRSMQRHHLFTYRHDTTGLAACSSVRTYSRFYKSYWLPCPWDSRESDCATISSWICLHVTQVFRRHPGVGAINGSSYLASVYQRVWIRPVKAHEAFLTSSTPASSAAGCRANRPPTAAARLPRPS